MQKRNVGLVMIYTIITLGIYCLYWYYINTQYLNRDETEQKPLMNFILAVLLGAITCGIYIVIWSYFFYKKLDKLTGDHNVMMNFLLGIILTPITGIGIAQNTINGYFDRS